MTTPLTEEALNNTPSQDTVDFLASIVGEGKKYKTVQDLAKAYHNADIHIRELQSKLDERGSEDHVMQEVLNELRKKNTPAEQVFTPETPAVRPAASEDQIAEIVNKTLEKRTAAQIAEAKKREGLTKLIEFYGSEETVFDVIRALIAKSPGVKKIIDDLSLTDPDMLFTFITTQMSKDAAPTSNAPGVQNASNGGQVSSNPHALTWTECQKVRKEDPRRYATGEFRKEMENAAVAWAAAGKDFYAS